VTFYDRFVTLCANRGKNPSPVAVEIGLTKSTVSNWKKRGTSPTDATAQRIADYFGISVEHLMDGVQNEKDPAAKSREVSDDDLKFALFGGGPVSDAQFEEVKRFAQFVKERDAIENK